MAFLYNISPVLVILYFYSSIAIKDNAVEWPSLINIYNKKLVKFYILLFAWSLACAPLVMMISDIVPALKNPMHMYNLYGILVFFIVMQILRLVVERHEEEGEGKASVGKAVYDLVKDVIIFSAGYLTIYSNNIYFKVAGVVISISIIGAVVKYRIYDDIFKYSLYSKNNRRYVGSHPGHFLIHSFLDHLPRAYLYAAFSFSVIDLLLIQLNPEKAPKVFNVAPPLTNEFVDFLYFNIVTMATVGYGDITPISPLAKLLCAFKILFTIILMTSIFTLILNRFQKIANDTNG